VQTAAKRDDVAHVHKAMFIDDGSDDFLDR
jgi:hypothetical protein